MTSPSRPLPFLAPPLLIALMGAFFSTGNACAQELLVKDGQTVAFLGDSITAGGAKPGGYVTLVVKGLEANGVKITALNAGVSGNTSVDMLARLDNDVLAKKPDIMTLSCGVNDVWHVLHGVPLDQYRTNMTTMIDKAQAAKINVVILTPTLIKEADSTNSIRLEAYNDFLRALAAQRQIPLADLNADMRAIVKTNPSIPCLTTDGVHMAVRGNQMMAEGVLRSFGLNQAQINKAREAWLDLPDTSPVEVKLTLRQFNQLLGTAGSSATNQASLDAFVKERILKQQ